MAEMGFETGYLDGEKGYIIAETIENKSCKLKLQR